MKEEDIRKRSVFNRYLELVERDAESLLAHRSSFVDVNCPACAGANSEAAFDKSGFTYCECGECQTLFVNPRPAYAELQKFYADSVSTSFWVNEFFKPVMETRREKIFRPRASNIIQQFPHFREGRIGDIGAGFGIFLEELRPLWPKADLVAIEPSSEMAEICRGKQMHVVQSQLEDIAGNEEPFDLLTAFELFEHLYDPGLFLRSVHSKLKPGGIFYFTTLNGLGFDIQVLWTMSKSVSPPHHLNFFNPQSVRRILAENHFNVLEVSTPGNLDWDIVEGAVKHEGAKVERFWTVVERFGSSSAKSRLQSWISESNLSSHMRVVTQKI